VLLVLLQVSVGLVQRADLLFETAGVFTEPDEALDLLVFEVAMAPAPAFSIHAGDACGRIRPVPFYVAAPAQTW